MKFRAALILVSFSLACGGGESPATPDAEPDPTPAPTPEPTPDPEPTGDLRGDAKAGEQTYAQFCVVCHGPNGAGDGPAAPQDPAPADFTDADYMGQLSDAHIYKVIKEGGAAVGKSPLMVPWGPVLSDQQIRDVLARVRQFSGS